MTTFYKVRDYFRENEGKEVGITLLRDKLSIDFYSMEIILKQLVKEEFIVLAKNKKYKLK